MEKLKRITLRARTHRFLGSSFNAEQLVKVGTFFTRRRIRRLRINCHVTVKKSNLKISGTRSIKPEADHISPTYTQKPKLSNIETSQKGTDLYPYQSPQLLSRSIFSLEGTRSIQETQNQQLVKRETRAVGTQRV